MQFPDHFPRAVAAAVVNQDDLVSKTVIVHYAAYP